MTSVATQRYEVDAFTEKEAMLKETEIGYVSGLVVCRDGNSLVTSVSRDFTGFAI